MIPDHSLSAMIHSDAYTAKPRGSFGKHGGEPAGPQRRPRSAEEVLGPTPGIRKAGEVARRNTKGGAR